MLYANSLLQDHIIRMDDQGLGGMEGAGPNNNPPAPQDVGLGAGLGAAHQAMLQGGAPVGFQPYKRPSFFVARVRYIALSKIALQMSLPLWGQGEIHSLKQPYKYPSFVVAFYIAFSNSPTNVPSSLWPG